MPRDLILPRGPSSANLMFILDYATADDAAQGQAWSGKYTNIVKQLCRDHRINYNETYRTLYYKTLLAYRGHSIKEKRAAIEAARQERNYDKILAEEITQLKPRIIVPMGELSLNFITLEKGITKFRGSILPLRQDLQNQIPYPIYVIPTLSPEQVNSIPISKAYVGLDYNKFSPENTDKLTFSTDIETIICGAPSTLQNFLSSYPASDFPVGVFDIETFYNVPVCIGICFDGKQSLTIPLLDKSVSQGDALFYWNRVDQLLRERTWFNQNIKYDILLLERFGFKVPNVIGDTGLRASVIYPELPKNLGFLNSIYNSIPYFKDEGKNSTDRKTLYTYCGKDCISTHRIFYKQEEELKDLGLIDFERNVQSLFWPYIRLESRGLLVDQEQLLKLRIEYENYYYSHLSALQILSGAPNLNPISPQQVANLIYYELKYPFRRDRQTGNLATGEEVLEELYTFQTCKTGPLGQSILELIIGCRKFAKVVQLCATSVHPDSRMRNSYDLGGTRTGRSAGKRTPDFLLVKEGNKYFMSEIGHSLQTLSKHGFTVSGIKYGDNIRSIFVPTPGFILVEGDLSQAESRVDAVLAKDFDFLPAFDTPPGVHVLTGEWIFGYRIDKKKEPEKYHQAKTVRHAAERNMGPNRLAMMLQQPLKFCEDVLTKLHNKQPNIRKVFHKDVEDFLINNRYLRSPNGRRRDFFDNPGHEMLNEAISQLPQSIVSDQIKFSLPLLEDTDLYKRGNIYFCYEGHDALMAEIPRSSLSDYSEIFRRIVERPIDFRYGSLPRDYTLIIPTEISWSETSWQDMQDYREEVTK